MGSGCRLLSGRGGFTLLELLLVVTVLSAVAWMSLGVVSNNADQVRFEDTRNRLQAIRRAIIGDTSRTINGQPEVRGFVADMGGLPLHLQALVSQNYCDDLPQYTTSGACTGAGGVWVTQNNYAQDPTTGIWAGWRGPYLTMDSLTSAASPRFLDGWGNNDNSGDFGWTYSIYTDSDQKRHLLVQSLGRDGVIGGAPPYENDYPVADTPPQASQRLISESEYRIKITDSGDIVEGDATGGLRVDFGAPASCWVCYPNKLLNNKAACEISLGGRWVPDASITAGPTCTASPHNGAWQPSQDVCMAMTVVKDGSPVQLISYGATTVQWDGTQKIPEFIFEDAVGPNYDQDTYLFQGQIAYGIFEYDSTATPQCQITKPFPAGSATWKNFTYVPGTTLQPFERKINP